MRVPVQSAPVVRVPAVAKRTAAGIFPSSWSDMDLMEEPALMEMDMFGTGLDDTVTLDAWSDLADVAGMEEMDEAGELAGMDALDDFSDMEAWGSFADMDSSQELAGMETWDDFAGMEEMASDDDASDVGVYEEAALGELQSLV